MSLPADGQEVTLGIRPEHLEIDPSGDTMTVELTEALGGVSYAHLRADTGESVIVEERGDERIAEGSRVGLTFDPTRAFIFDRKSEARIR